MIQLCIQTSDSSKKIKNAINALLKSGNILSATKIPYTKLYHLHENKKTITTNIQLLIFKLSEKREKSGPKILDQLLEEREISSLFSNIENNKIDKVSDEIK